MEADTYEFPLTLRVPRSAFVLVAPEPATVTQWTVEQHFGIPPRTYRSMVRDGLFPVKRIGHLIFATYEDVRRAVTEGAVAKTRVERVVKTTVVEQQEAPMGIEEAFEYVGSARTPREKRERTREISTLSWDLAKGYGPNLDDGSPNPKHGNELYEHGMRLSLAAAGLRPGVVGQPGARRTRASPKRPRKR